MTHDEYVAERDKITEQRGKLFDNAGVRILDEKWQYLESNWQNMTKGEDYPPKTNLFEDNQYTRAQRKVEKKRDWMKQQTEMQEEAWKTNQYGGYE